MTFSRDCVQFAMMLGFVALASNFGAAEQTDPADLPAPMTLKRAHRDPLDDLDPSPVKPLPYHEMVDDAVTPMQPSTTAQFLTNIEDVGPYDILERPGIPVGWFSGLELTAANVQMSNRMQSEGLLSGTFPNPVSVPSAPLDWTAMPRLTVGYQMSEGWGSLSASYRFLDTQGNGSVPGGSAFSRLQQHVLDLDYTLADLFPTDLCLVPRQLTITAGVRVAAVNYKTSASGGTVLSQSASNTLYGAGPRLSFDTQYPIRSGQWAVFGRVDTAAIVGTDSQTFSQTTTGMGAASGSASTSSTIAAPVLGLRAGTNWYPPWGQGLLKMSAGYQWERWYMLGPDSTSYNELTIQGPFLQGEVAF